MEAYVKHRPFGSYGGSDNPMSKLCQFPNSVVLRVLVLGTGCSRQLELAL